MSNKKDLFNAIGISKNDNNNNNNNQNNDGINPVARVLKVIAILTAIIGIYYGVVVINSQTYSLPVIFGSIGFAIFDYGFGEIIQLLEDIKNK